MFCAKCGVLSAGVTIRPVSDVVGAHIEAEMHCGTDRRGPILFNRYHTETAAYPFPRRRRYTVLDANLIMWTDSQLPLGRSTYVG